MLRPLLRTDQRALPRINVVDNPSNELNITRWSGTSATLARSTAWAYPGSGTASCRVTTTTATSSAGDVRFAGTGANVLPPGVIPGRWHTFSAWCNTPAAHTTYVTADTSRQRRIIVFLSIDGTTNYVQDWGPIGPNVAGVFRVEHRFWVPPTTTGAVVAIGCAGSATDPAFVTYVDAILLELDTPAPARTAFDGSMRNARWAGTAHLSPTYGFAYPGR